MAQGRKGTGSARNSFRPVPCVIAIDQSYTRTGLAICVRGQVKKATSVKLVNIKSKTMKRAAVQDMLNKAISSLIHLKYVYSWSVSERLLAVRNQ